MRSSIKIPIEAMTKAIESGKNLYFSFECDSEPRKLSIEIGDCKPMPYKSTDQATELKLATKYHKELK